MSIPGDEPHRLPIAEAGRRLRDGSLTAAALAQAALARIAVLDPALHAFVTVTGARALAEAEQADAELLAGVDRGPLHGIPYALKDVIATRGIRTTSQSRLRLDHVPAEDAFVAARLREAGAVLLGKLATYEFATVGPDFGLPFPPARNPWNAAHIPGGSSSGAAAAVAAGLLRTAIGTDTGGSIRSPACYCGVVGLKPTYGRVSRRGVQPLSWSLDHVGPLSRSVADAALTFSAMAGHDPADPASADTPLPDFGFGVDLAGIRIGYPRGFHASDPLADAEIVAALDAAAERMATLGASVVECDLPDNALFEACGSVILHAEAYAVHRRDLAARAGDYGRLALQNLASGFALGAADLLRAQQARRWLARQLAEAMAGVDALMTANALTTAPPFAAFGATPRWTAMRTLAFNVTGNPVLALPIGFSRAGLPIGMQLVGHMFDEATPCRIGAAYEAAAGWSDRWPASQETG